MGRRWSTRATSAIAVAASLTVVGITIPATVSGAIEIAPMRSLTAPSAGYWVVGPTGDVGAFGSTQVYRPAGLAASPTIAPVVASAQTAGGKGYWLAATNGTVTPFGDAVSYGDMHGAALNSPIVALAATPTGHGYILLG